MDALGGLFQKFINWLFSTGAIKVPEDFHDQCAKIKYMIDNDISGVVSTLTGYAVNSASEARLKVECDDETLEDIFNIWLSKININVNGIPKGLSALAQEYYKERWQGSSLCLLKVSNWETIQVNQTKVSVPTVLWFVNGSTVYIKRKDENIVKSGNDNYYFDKDEKKLIVKTENEDLIVQKPFSRWISKYPSPYLVYKGVLKNWLGLEVLVGKSDEVISKVLPYLFIMEKGDKDVFLQTDIDYSDPELKTMVDGFKQFLERYQQEGAKVPATGVPFDQKYSHLIPDLTKILSAELYTQGYRSILAGLGFISVVQGIGDTRKEEVLNPKPFIAEVNAGVRDFKSILMDVIQLIIDENKLDHRKLFSTDKSLEITNSPIKINIESMLDVLRSGFVYGAIGYTTFQEILGVDPEQELERAKKEWEKDYRTLFYPHAIQNSEDKGIDTTLPTTKKQIEKKTEKETKPKNMEESEVVNEPIDPNLSLEIAPYKDVQDLLSKHPYMKKYPAGALQVFIEVFNESLPKGEDYAFPVAYTAMKRWLKAHGYKKINDKWVKEEK